MLPWVYESIKNYASLLKKSCISHSTPQVCLDRDGFLFKRKKSHVSATTGFAVYVTGFCLNISESNCQHWCLKIYFVLSVFRTHLSIKPQSCRKPKLFASSLTWLGFYSDITPRCDWRFIKTQKLEVEKIARSPAPLPCQGRICGRCFCSETHRSAVPVMVVIHYCPWEPRTILWTAFLQQWESHCSALPRLRTSLFETWSPVISCPEDWRTK